MIYYTAKERRSLNYSKKLFFHNGYGVSIISNPFSYGGDKGLYELAALKGTKDSYDICYDTPIIDDVVGYLTLDEAMKIASDVEKL